MPHTCVSLSFIAAEEHKDQDDDSEEYTPVSMLFYCSQWCIIWLAMFLHWKATYCFYFFWVDTCALLISIVNLFFISVVTKNSMTKMNENFGEIYILFVCSVSVQLFLFYTFFLCAVFIIYSFVSDRPKKAKSEPLQNVKTMGKMV